MKKLVAVWTWFRRSFLWRSLEEEAEMLRKKHGKTLQLLAGLAGQWTGTCSGDSDSLTYLSALLIDRKLHVRHKSFHFALYNEPVEIRDYLYRILLEHSSPLARAFADMVERTYLSEKAMESRLRFRDN